MISWALALIEQLVPTGLNCNGMAIRLAHAWGVSGEVTTLLTLVTLAGFSAVGVLLGTTTNQHRGVVVPPPGRGWMSWPQPNPGASRPVSTWKSCWPVPFE